MMLLHVPYYEEQHALCCGFVMSTRVRGRGFDKESCLIIFEMYDVCLFLFVQSVDVVYVCAFSLYTTVASIRGDWS